MSSTPLFDSIARRAPHTGTARRMPAPPAAPAPTSPMTAPIAPGRSDLVPAALVAAIDAIPQRVGTALPTGVAVPPDQLALVEAVTDALTRAVVDAVVGELERITRDGVVHG